MNQEKIGKFIAKLRKEKNMTQLQLSLKLGVTDRAISKWENGRGMPDLSLMKPLCNELGITINDLLSGEVIDKNNLNRNVIGIAVNTKICNAVKRNKIKRVIREAYYKEQKTLKQGYNIVFLWNKKEPVENINFHKIHKEIKDIFKEAELIEKV